MGKIASPTTLHTHIVDENTVPLCGTIKKPYNWTGVNAQKPYLSTCDACRDKYNQLTQPKATIHILAFGFPLCHFSQEVPGQWPPDHTWIGFEDEDATHIATCTTCKNKLRDNFDRQEKKWAY